MLVSWFIYLLIIDTLNDAILTEDPKTLDENSDKSFDLTDTEASALGEPEESEESLNELEEEYKALKKKVKEKLNQLGGRVILCIKDLIATDFESGYQDLLVKCVGVNFDILEREFKRFMLDVRELFKGLVLQELAPFKEGNIDTENFLMDTIEFLAEKDFKMVKGFEILKLKVGYFVQNPKLFDDFLEIVEDVFIGWDKFLQMMIDLKVSIKQEIKEKLIKREEMLKLYFEKNEHNNHEHVENDNLEFTEAGKSEENGLNEFEELQHQNNDEQKEEETEESSVFSDISQQEESGEGDQEESSVAEDSEESNDETEKEVSQATEESEIEKTEESEDEEEGENKPEEEGKGEGEGKDEKKQETPKKERILKDLDEDEKIQESKKGDLSKN